MCPTHVCVSHFMQAIHSCRCLTVHTLFVAMEMHAPTYSIYLTHNKCDIYNIQQRRIFISLFSFFFCSVLLFCVPSLLLYAAAVVVAAQWVDACTICEWTDGRTYATVFRFPLTGLISSKSKADAKLWLSRMKYKINYTTERRTRDMPYIYADSRRNEMPLIYFLSKLKLKHFSFFCFVSFNFFYSNFSQFVSIYK